MNDPVVPGMTPGRKNGPYAAIGRLSNFGDMYTVLSVLVVALAGLTFLLLWSRGCMVDGVMLAGALFVSGSFLGFLFGVPKTGATSGAQTADGNGGFVINNNLEEISDWLTKMVVGVSLTQLDTIKDKTVHLSRIYGQTLGGQPVALAAIVFFAVCGFMFGYLWTTLFYAAALNRAKRAADSVMDQMRQAIEDLKDDRAKDAEAKARVADFLDPRQAQTPESTGRMRQAVLAASPAYRALIFAKVANLRSAKWKDDKPALPPMIPVLQALIEAAPDDHRLHGELGFVLKDKDPADPAAAIAELDTAIALRDKNGVKGWLNYEFNRALARIVAQPGAKDAILADLRAAAPDWKAKYPDTPAIKAWLDGNGLEPDHLDQTIPEA